MMPNLVTRLAVTSICASLLAAWPALAEDELFRGRPGLAGPERPPTQTATCENLHSGLKGFAPPDTRVDLWVSGPLTMVRTDETLWYLVICSQPGIRVLCVT
jgi:hypothetical protein